MGIWGSRHGVQLGGLPEVWAKPSQREYGAWDSRCRVSVEHVGARWGTLGHVAWNASIQIRIDPFPTVGPLGTRRLLGSGTPASSWLMLQAGVTGKDLGKD